jgi:hypothetical protein
MPRIVVTADSTADHDASVLLDETVQPVHLSSDHAAMQLIERLACAIADAEEGERSSSRRTGQDGGPAAAASAA